VGCIGLFAGSNECDEKQIGNLRCTCVAGIESAVPTFEEGRSVSAWKVTPTSPFDQREMNVLGP